MFHTFCEQDLSRNESFFGLKAENKSIKFETSNNVFFSVNQGVFVRDILNPTICFVYNILSITKPENEKYRLICIPVY